MRKSYSISQVAEALSVSARTVRRMIDGGELGFIKVRGLVRITDRQLDAYISGLEAKASYENGFLTADARE